MPVQSVTDSSFPVGALVQWTQGPGYGVISEVGATSISVRWDDPSKPSQFRVLNPPLLRVEFAPGHAVKRGTTNETAVVQNLSLPVPPTWQVLVMSTNGTHQTLNVPEADLRPVPIVDPVKRFKSGNIGSLKKYLLREVVQWYRNQHLHDDLVSLGHVGVDLKPHQVFVVHRVISEYPHRFLLADEVGLGKTIEAGTILKELRARGGAERVLAIVPPNLLRQWQFEMKTKFNERFSILNSDTVNYLRAQGFDKNPFTYRESVLCSSKWVSQPAWAELCASVPWDLVIVDEAHHARSRRNGDRVTRTRLYDLVCDLAAADHLTRGMLFLTATPMQLDTHELYSLVELLDPSLFPSEDHFERHRKAVPGLSLLVERLHHHGFPLPQEDPVETTGKVAQWLDLNSSEARARLDDASAREQLAADLSDCHLLSRMLIRNRKVVVGGFMPRQAYRWTVELSAQERAALRAIREYVEFGFRLAEDHEHRAIGFVMVIYQKLMASSAAAVRRALNRRRARLMGEIRQGAPVESETWLEDDDADADSVQRSGIVADALDDEISLIDGALAELKSVTDDSKAGVLVDQLAALFGDQPEAKVLIFTEFRETQRYLFNLLRTQGWDINLFHGQLSPDQKDDAVTRVRSHQGPQILISTEAGGEGRNLQFCHILVNYDLPWNPMRIEQRIGRLDRIGQENVVSIFNFEVKNTIEEDILDVLEYRIGIFQDTVGGLDPILGETERDIRRIMRQAEEMKATALEEFGQRVEEQVRKARDAADRLGDFIMDTKSFRREIVERITGHRSSISNARIERFVAALLSEVGTHIGRFGSTYRLSFRGEFLKTYRNTLFVGGPTVSAVFRPDLRPDAENVELMAFGHPIVDAIVERVLDEGYNGAAGTRCIPADDDLLPGKGWLFTYQLTVPGVQSTEHLVPIFVGDQGEADAEVGQRLLDRAGRFDRREQEIPTTRIPDNLDSIEPFARQFANRRQQELQTEAERRASAQVDREVARLSSWFDYQEQVASDRLAATRATVDRLRASDDESVRRILPVWEANLKRDEQLPERIATQRRRRIADAEQYRFPQVTWSLKSLGRIEVV